MSHAFDRGELFALFGRSVDGTLSATDHARLEAILSSSEAARKLWFEYSDLETGLADWAALEGQATSISPSIPAPSFIAEKKQQAFRRFGYWPKVAAIALLCLIALWSLRPWPASEEVTPGVAVLARSVDAEWSVAADERSVGAILGPETLHLTRGAVQLDFYSGARVILEGPAEASLISPMEVKLIAGKMRVHVPPLAEGFVVNGPDFRVVDRGTEFGVAVSKDAAEVHVFQGRVEIAAADKAEAVRTLIAGQAVQHSSQVWNDSQADSSEFLNETGIVQQESQLAKSRFAAWRSTADEIDRKSETILHYWFDASLSQDARVGLEDIVNHAADAAPATTGRSVGCEWVQGRWPTSRALQWCGEGDRVRFRVERPMEQVTFVAWVRIPHLREGLSSLVCAEGEAVGSLHWEISRTGQLRLAIARDLGRARADWEAVDSRPFITSERLGQWIQLVTTFDGTTVRHYGNGELIGSGAAFHPPALLLGTADVGNSNGRVVRAFSGAFDELLILSRALTADEVRNLYEHGKP